MKTTYKSLLQVSLLSAAIVTSAGVSAAGNDLRWGLTGDAISLDPQGRLASIEFIFLRMGYEGLMTLDANQQPIYALAQSHKVLDDGTYRFNLRKGVKFHGGQNFTADDVVFSFNRANEPTSAFKSFTSSIGTVTKVDDYTVDIKTNRPNPLLYNNIASVFIMDSGWAEEHGVSAAPDAKNPAQYYSNSNMNGTGPFVMVDRKPDVKTSFTRNTNWWGNSDDRFPGNIDSIEATPIGNSATRVATLLSGDLDLVTEVPLPDIDRVASDPNLKTDSTEQFRTIFLGYNLATDDLETASVDGNPFKDVRVRQAVDMAIDTPLIQKKIMRGISTPTSLLAYPGTDGYDANMAAPSKVDRAGAIALLAEAGYPEGFGIRLDCPNNRYINDEAICQAVTSMLAKVGIKVTLNAMPKDQWMPLLTGKKSDFYMLGFGTPTGDSLFTFGHIYKGGPFQSGYANARVTELIGMAGSELDPVKRKAQMKEISQITLDESAISPLHYQVITWGMSNRTSIPVDVNNIPDFRFAVMQ